MRLAMLLSFGFCCFLMGFGIQHVLELLYEYEWIYPASTTKSTFNKTKEQRRSYNFSSIASDAPKENEDVLHNSTKVINKSNNANSHVFFHMNTTRWIDEMEGCIRDPSCQVFFHHVQKASGTYIGSTLYYWINLGRFPPTTRKLLNQSDGTIWHLSHHSMLSNVSDQIKFNATRRNIKRKRAESYSDTVSMDIQPTEGLGANERTLLSKATSTSTRRVPYPPSNNRNGRPQKNSYKNLQRTQRRPELGPYARKGDRTKKVNLVKKTTSPIPIDEPKPLQNKVSLTRRSPARPRTVHLGPKENGCCHDNIMKRLYEELVIMKSTTYNHDPMEIFNRSRFMCQRKFSMWEVSPEQMMEVLDLCFYGKNGTVREVNVKDEDVRNVVETNDRSRRQQIRYTRAVVLVPYREPKSRMTSLIGHVCNFGELETRINKIFGGPNKNPFYLQMPRTEAGVQNVIQSCQQCSYDFSKNKSTTDSREETFTPYTDKFDFEENSLNDNATLSGDTEFFDRVIRQTNDLFNGVQRLVSHIMRENEAYHPRGHRRTMDTTTTVVKRHKNQPPDFSSATPGEGTQKRDKLGVQALLLDVTNDDVNQFFQLLQERFPKKPIPNGSGNLHTVRKVCYFNFTQPENFRAAQYLSPGCEMYENFQSGLLF